MVQTITDNSTHHAWHADFSYRDEAWVASTLTGISDAEFTKLAEPAYVPEDELPPLLLSMLEQVGQ